MLLAEARKNVDQVDPTRDFGRTIAVAGLHELREILDSLGDTSVSLYTHHPHIDYTFVRPVTIDPLQDGSSNLTVMVYGGDKPIPIVFSSDNLPNLRLTMDRTEVLIEVPGEGSNLLIENVGQVASIFS